MKRLSMRQDGNLPPHLLPHVAVPPHRSSERVQSHPGCPRYGAVQPGDSAPQVRATEKKQRHLAEAKVSERLQLLREYEELLSSGQAEEHAAYEEATTAAWRAALPWKHRLARYACD